MYKNFAHLDTFIDHTTSNLNDNKLNEYIVRRSNQICLSFSYFGTKMNSIIEKYFPLKIKVFLNHDLDLKIN